MKQKFYKTDHFKYRQWDRGIEDCIVDAVTSKLNILKTKSTIIVSARFLKSLKLQISKNSHLIIVSKEKSLLTLFFVNDLYAYLKSLKGNINTIIVE